MSDEKVNYVSLAELEADDDELVGFRPNVDANEFLPPLVHGSLDNKDANFRPYLVKVTFNNADPAQRWLPDTTTKGEPKKYYKTSLKLVTEGNADETWDGKEFSYFCSTLVRRGGTTGVQAVLQGLGVPQEDIEANKTRGAQTILLNHAVDDGDGTAEVEIDWEASYFDADYMDPDTGEKVGKEYFRLRGMERFPQAQEGQDDFSKALASVDGTKHYYPWVDIDVTNLDATVVVLPTEAPAPGRNIHRAFVRNYVRRFKTRTVLTAAPKATAAAAASGPRVAPAATPAAAHAPAAAPTPTPSKPGARQAPTPVRR